MSTVHEQSVQALVWENGTHGIDNREADIAALTHLFGEQPEDLTAFFLQEMERKYGIPPMHTACQLGTTAATKWLWIRHIDGQGYQETYKAIDTIYNIARIALSLPLRFEVLTHGTRSCKGFFLLVSPFHVDLITPFGTVYMEDNASTEARSALIERLDAVFIKAISPSNTRDPFNAPAVKESKPFCPLFYQIRHNEIPYRELSSYVPLLNCALTALAPPPRHTVEEESPPPITALANFLPWFKEKMTLLASVGTIYGRSNMLETIAQFHTLAEPDGLPLKCEYEYSDFDAASNSSDCPFTFELSLTLDSSYKWADYEVAYTSLLEEIREGWQTTYLRNFPSIETRRSEIDHQLFVKTDISEKESALWNELFFLMDLERSDVVFGKSDEYSYFWVPKSEVATILSKLGLHVPNFA